MKSNFVWKKYKDNPVFSPKTNTWQEDQTANPDILLYKNMYFMYFRGQQNGHDRIGVGTISKRNFDGINWDIHPEAIIDIGSPGDCDELHILDPATVLVNDKIYLYYSAVSTICDRSICLATSTDGINFKKYKDNPIVIGGGPEIAFKDGLFYLYYWQSKKNGVGYEIHLSTSKDGFNFKKYSNAPVLPAGKSGSWDCHTVETPRIFKEGNLYYMMYCGSDRYDDYPWHAGLAISQDLIHWKKYPDNPIFTRGEKGKWDEGAIWFTTVEKINGKYFMWYEGYGGGTARTEPYGSYLKGGKSQIGMAILDAECFYLPT